MKMIIVEVCDANKLNVLDIEEIIEEEYPEVAVIINQCLSVCGLCHSVPFSIVNNEIVYGKTPEECLDNIRKQIEKELEAFKDL